MPMTILLLLALLLVLVIVQRMYAVQRAEARVLVRSDETRQIRRRR